MEQRLTLWSSCRCCHRIKRGVWLQSSIRVLHNATARCRDTDALRPTKVICRFATPIPLNAAGRYEKRARRWLSEPPTPTIFHEEFDDSAIAQGHNGQCDGLQIISCRSCAYSAFPQQTTSGKTRASNSNGQVCLDFWQLMLLIYPHRSDCAAARP